LEAWCELALEKPSQIVYERAANSKSVIGRYLERRGPTLAAPVVGSMAGPRTNLARSTECSTFAVMAAGATASESGTGNTRIVSVTDASHPT
jgi:hypothetical protein